MYNYVTCVTVDVCLQAGVHTGCVDLVGPVWLEVCLWGGVRTGGADLVERAVRLGVWWCAFGVGDVPVVQTL